MIGRSFSSSIVAGCAVDLDVVFEACPILAVPEGRIRFCAPIAFDHVDRRQALGLQRCRFEIDLHLPLLAAVGIGNRRALTVTSCVRMKFRPKSIELLLGESLAGKAELQNRHAGSVVVMISGGVVPARQLPQLRLRDRRDLRDGLIED